MTTHSYTLMPFNFGQVNNQILLTGTAGDYIFLNRVCFNDLINYKLDKNTETYLNLKSKNFISDSKDELLRAIDMTATRYRTKKGFLNEFTTLHMMVITVRCNQKCKYCQVSCEEEEARQYDMSPETACTIVDFILKSPSKNIKIEFQGGEPLLNWDTIVKAVIYAKERNIISKKNLEFVICTNLTSSIEDKLSFIKEHNIAISTSLDGSKDIHDCCRVFRGGTGTYDKFVSNLQLCKKSCGDDSVGALMTTSSYSLNNIKSIIDEYLANGFDGIFLRAINPYGFAEENKNEIGYPTQSFVEMYKVALEYILNINRNGRYFVEFYTTLLLSRILTPFPTGFVDLQSPSGAGISGVIYDYNGDVYPADEGRMLARMGDKYFLMGNVHSNSYREIFQSKVIKEIVNKSCLEVMPHCYGCVFEPYCGADPIRNYLETKDIMGYRLDSGFCEKNKAIFSYLFSIIESNSDANDIFWSWITEKHLMDINDETY